MMASEMLYLLTLILLVLIAATAYRGYRAWKHQNQDALTIEEGLGTIKNRLTARDALQTVLVVAIVSIICAAVAMLMFYQWRQPKISEAILLALVIVAIGFLLIPWYHRASDSVVVQMLDQEEAGIGKGNLRRLMRTYLYYNSDPSRQKPGLFDWIRRQLGLYILGLDIRAHIPFSGNSIAKQSSIMMFCVLILTVLLAFMGEPPREFEYQFAEGTTPTEIEDDSEYEGAPDPEGDTETPQYGADNQESEQTQQDNAPAPEQEPEMLEEEVPPPTDDPSTDKPDPGDDGGGEDPGESESLVDKMVASLMEMLGQEEPGEDQPSLSPPDTSSNESGLAQGPSDESAAQGKAPDTMAGTGDQQIGQPTTSPGAGEGSPDGDPENTSDNQDLPPSDESAGGSQQARVSRGGGGGLVGAATEVPTDLSPDARAMELKVDAMAEEEEGKESEQLARPQRYNTKLELKPDDVNVTQADPLVTQRIPRSYENTIRKLLSKP